ARGALAHREGPGAVPRAQGVLVGGDGEQLAGDGVELGGLAADPAPLALDHHALAVDPEAELDAGAVVAVVDERTAQLGDRHPEVLGVVEAEAEVGRQARGGQSQDPQVRAPGGDEQDDVARWVGHGVGPSAARGHSPPKAGVGSGERRMITARRRREMSIEVAPRFTVLADVRRQFRSWLQESDIPRDVVEDLVLVATELCTNAVEATPDGERVQLQADFDREAVRLAVTNAPDTG